ncbi:MAG: hypothetical protein ACLQBQ_07480 [Smithella sp.]
MGKNVEPLVPDCGQHHVPHISGIHAFFNLILKPLPDDFGNWTGRYRRGIALAAAYSACRAVDHRHLAPYILHIASKSSF